MKKVLLSCFLLTAFVGMNTVFSAESGIDAVAAVNQSEQTHWKKLYESLAKDFAVIGAVNPRNVNLNIDLMNSEVSFTIGNISFQIKNYRMQINRSDREGAPGNFGFAGFKGLKAFKKYNIDIVKIFANAIQKIGTTIDEGNKKEVSDKRNLLKDYMEFIQNAYENL